MFESLCLASCRLKTGIERKAMCSDFTDVVAALVVMQIGPKVLCVRLAIVKTLPDAARTSETPKSEMLRRAFTNMFPGHTLRIPYNTQLLSL